MSGLDADGAKLIDAAFGGLQPVIVFNALRTETEVNEQRGLANIMTGGPAVSRPQLSEVSPPQADHGDLRR